eukprot:EG_transcript_28415
MAHFHGCANLSVCALCKLTICAIAHQPPTLHKVMVQGIVSGFVSPDQIFQATPHGDKADVGRFQTHVLGFMCPALKHLNPNACWLLCDLLSSTLTGNSLPTPPNCN